MPCGIESIAGLLGGAGDVKAPGAGGVGRDYLGLLNQGYAKGIPQLLDLQEQFQPRLTDLNLQDFARVIPMLTDALSKVGPTAGNLVDRVNPGQAGLLDTLTRSATDQLNAGDELDPGLRRVFQQSVRGAQADRGMGFGPSDVFNESLSLTDLANNLRQMREQFAGNVAGLNYNYRTSPAMALLTGIPSAAGAIQRDSTNAFLSPAGSMNLLTMPYQGRLSAATSSASNATQLLGQSSSNSNWT